MTVDPDIVATTFRAFALPGDLVEMRILNAGHFRTLSGYFKKSEPFVHEAAEWSGKAPAVYFTINPCQPALLARADNRLKSRAQKTTADSDIVRRRWFPIDFDAVRPSGISATDQEHAAALMRARACRDWLSGQGWPLPVFADSGNGAHLPYAVDLPNDTASTALLKCCLEALDLYFTDGEVCVDRTTYNAARIWKVYGTMVCKGDDLGERPHRLARLLELPPTREVVTKAQLEALAAMVPAPAPPPRHTEPWGHTTFDLEQWIADHHVPVVSHGAWGSGGQRWILNPCPWNSDHTNRAAFVVQFANGAIAAGCHHNGCAGKEWHALRDLYEPDWRVERDHPPRLRVHGTAPGPEPHDPYACPELPAYARVDEDRAAGASRFLNHYIDFSRTWAPRAYEGFHEACGLFALSTVAARRVRLQFGPRGVYTSLYIGLVARTTLFTKTTAADLALEVIKAAGLGYLLADDDASPQAFLRSLTRYVPINFGELSDEDQERRRLQLAFTAQRGWFYEEWGQHLEGMMQKNGFMAAFRGILRRLDDHRERYTYSTISRGEDVIIKPYLSLLANVTPADLQPFVKAGSSLWRDGYIARMAFVAPDEADFSEKEFPQQAMTIPAPLVKELQGWHKRLKIPHAKITKVTGTKGKPTPLHTVSVTPLEEKTYMLSDEVREGFYAYDKALRQLTRQRRDEDFDGSYGRLPMKALRIAGLLGSLQDDDDSHTIELPEWSRGQHIAEHWRRDLHRLVQQMQRQEAPSRLAVREDRLLHLLRDKGPQTVGRLHTLTKWPRTEINTLCEDLVSAHVLTKDVAAKAVKYSLNGMED